MKSSRSNDLIMTVSMRSISNCNIGNNLPKIGKLYAYFSMGMGLNTKSLSVVSIPSLYYSFPSKNGCNASILTLAMTLDNVGLQIVSCTYSFANLDDCFLSTDMLLKVWMRFSTSVVVFCKWYFWIILQKYC